MSKNSILTLKIQIKKDSNSYSTLYIRAKQLNVSVESSEKAHSNDGNIFAFDVADFVNFYDKSASSANAIRWFNLKYKVVQTQQPGFHLNCHYRQFPLSPTKSHY